MISFGLLKFALNSPISPYINAVKFRGSWVGGFKWLVSINARNPFVFCAVVHNIRNAWNSRSSREWSAIIPQLKGVQKISKHSVPSSPELSLNVWLPCARRILTWIYKHNLDALSALLTILQTLSSFSVFFLFFFLVYVVHLFLLILLFLASSSSCSSCSCSSSRFLFFLLILHPGMLMY